MHSRDDATMRHDTRSSTGKDSARRRWRAAALTLACGIGLGVVVLDGIDVEPVGAAAASLADPDTTPDTATTGGAAPAGTAARTAPVHVTPADDLAAMTRPAAGSPPAATSMVQLTPAMQARLATEERASRTALRGTEGARAGFARPVDGTTFTSKFGMRWGRLHAGVDFAGPIGLPIRAVSPGTVTVAGPASGYGQLIEIRHVNGEIARYGHLSKIRVKVGQKVAPAQIIGDLGNEGRSTGPHLHFEIRTPKGVPFDPMPWLKARGIVPLRTATPPAPVVAAG